LFYRARGAPAEAATSIALGSVVEGEFELKYDEPELNKALVTRQWAGVAAILMPVIQPILPYLPIPGNNGVELALQAGSALMKISAAQAGKPGEDPEKTKARYLEAYRILRAAGEAAWYPPAESAQIRAVLCLVLTGDLKRAVKEFNAIREPEPGDAAYGMYWYTLAQLRIARGETRDAMDAVIRSLVFETKDIDCFPDALLLSARCYEELLEPHRARDVYYEVGRLFPHTEWAEAATNRLAAIMDKGLTKGKEPSAIEVVFFGLDEDMNAKVREFLAGAAQEPTEKEVDIEKELEREDSLPLVRPAVDKEKKEGEPQPPAAPPPATGPGPSGTEGVRPK
jgi:TolA-binding protein